MGGDDYLPIYHQVSRKLVFVYYKKITRLRWNELINNDSYASIFITTPKPIAIYVAVSAQRSGKMINVHEKEKVLLPAHAVHEVSQIFT